MPVEECGECTQVVFGGEGRVGNGQYLVFARQMNQEISAGIADGLDMRPGYYFVDGRNDVLIRFIIGDIVGVGRLR